MDKTMLKELVKKHFNLTDKTEETTITENFAEAVLVDGTKVTNMVDADFAEGQVLHVITAEGEHVIAPEGAHVTESGIEIVVDGQGTITQVNRPDESEMEESMPVEEEMAEEEIIEEEVMEEKEEVALEEGDIKEAIIEAIAEAVMPEIDAMKEEMAEIKEQMKEYMSASSAVPTSEAKFSKSPLNKFNKSIQEPTYNKRRYEVALKNITKKTK